ncbi:uncharacterized protein [Nicotiana tomentosiformis]|uniref:uncharacterized protein n=1 Tax=Nicotiana tomentosiformis TaxID=4098 RepID=UPI00388CA9C9
MSMPCIVSASTREMFVFGGVTVAIHEVGDGHRCPLPQGPGKAESTNKVIIQNLKKKLEDANEANNEALRVKLDLLEEHRDLAYVRMVAQKQRMERYYNRRANLRYFKVEDLVLRKVTQSTWEVNTGKLGSTWEGPYRVSSLTGKGSYELENQDGVKLPSNWNVTHLKRYYC